MKQKIKSLRRIAISVDFFEDERVIGLRAHFGPAGPMIAIALMTIIAHHGYYVAWDELIRLKLLSYLPDATGEFIDDIVGRMLQWGLLDAQIFDEHGILTSYDLQRQYFRAHRRKDHACPLPYLLDEEREPVAAEVSVEPIEEPVPHPDAPALPCNPTPINPFFAELLGEKEEQERPVEAPPARMVDVGV